MRRSANAGGRAPRDLGVVASAHYDALLEKPAFAGDTMRELALAAKRERLYFTGKPLLNALRPCFVGKDIYVRAMRAASLVAQAIDIVARRAVADEALLAQYGFPPHVRAVLEIDRYETGAPYLSRLDGFLTPDNEIRFVEINPEPAGVAYSQVFAELFDRLAIMREMKNRFRLETATSAEAEGSKAAQEVGRLLLDRPDPLIVHFVNADEPEPVLLQRYASSYLHCVEDPAILKVRKNLVWLDGRRVDFLTGINLRTLMNVAPGHPLVRAIRKGGVRMLNGIATSMLRNARLTFALMSDEENAHWFPPNVRRAIARCVPWTRQVRDESAWVHGKRVPLLDYVRAHKDRLVLKASPSTGGQGVTLGWRTDAAAWKRAVRKAAAGNYVVQERVHVPRATYPITEGDRIVRRSFYSDINPFVWNAGRAAGAVIRLSATDMLNVSLEGALVPLFLVSESSRKRRAR